MSNETEIDRVLKDFFPDPKFFIRLLKSEYNNVPRYKIMSTTIEGKKIICVFLNFFADHIYIELLEKCGINGRQTLEIIEQIALKLENISYISLEDASTLNVSPEFNIGINLYIYKILTKGQSWYNSLGYKSENYEQEVNDNNKFERMTIEEFQNYIISRNKNTNKYNEHLNVFSTIFSVELEKNITVPDFYKKVLEIIQNYEPDKKKVEWLKDDLIFVLVSNIVNYNAELLVKHIRGQKGGKTKKKKIKKRKSKKRKSKKRKSKNN